MAISTRKLLVHDLHFSKKGSKQHNLYWQTLIIPSPLVVLHLGSCYNQPVNSYICNVTVKHQWSNQICRLGKISKLTPCYISECADIILLSTVKSQTPRWIAGNWLSMTLLIQKYNSFARLKEGQMVESQYLVWSFLYPVTCIKWYANSWHANATVNIEFSLLYYIPCFQFRPKNR